MIREKIKIRRKHNPHANIPFVTDFLVLNGLSFRHVLYTMFMLYTEGGMRPKDIAERIGVSHCHILAILTRLKRTGMVKVRFVDAYSQKKMYFINDKNALLVLIMEHLSNKYGKVVIKGLSDYNEMLEHMDAYEKSFVVKKRKPKKARTKCQVKQKRSGTE